MHDAEFAVDDVLARALIDESFPELDGRALRRVHTAGTVNSIIRVGDDLVARFPLLPASRSDLAAEAAAMAALAEACPFPSPQPYGVADVRDSYPSAWSLQSWLPGSPAHFDMHAASPSLAQDLAVLITSLREVDPGGRGFDGRGRGGALPDHDDWVSQCLDRSAHLLDVSAATRMWAVLRALPRSGTDVMSHRDLTPFNLLVDVQDGETRLTGVLDGGGFGPADRALDLVAAWHLFDAPARQVLRAGVGAEEAEWLRGAAWAFQQAIGLGWYYAESNPPMSALGLSTVRRLLTDDELSALA
jgi:aminoglycoside phosphotransferase (APT) family kinase protein